jgi:hypothetical protein
VKGYGTKTTLESLTPGILGSSSPTKLEKNHINYTANELFRVVKALGPSVILPPGTRAAGTTVRATGLIRADQFSTVGAKYGVSLMIHYRPTQNKGWSKDPIIP